MPNRLAELRDIFQRILTTAAADSIAVRELVVRGLRALEHLEIQFQSPKRATRGKTVESYTVRDDMLNENRAGRSPFRVSRGHYDAAVDALADAGAEGLLADELRDQIGQRLKLGGPVPDFIVRTAVRFWRDGCDPPLLAVVGRRYRYAAASASSFRKAAKDAWDDHRKGEQRR